MEKVIFLIIALIILSAELILTHFKPNVVFGTIFVATILGFLAFYLFQYGTLSEFSLEAFSAKAKFLKEKVQEAKADVKAMNELKEESEKVIKEIESVKDKALKSELSIEEIKESIFGLQGDLVKVKKGLVEMEYLQYAGRNRFPNPYHDRIIRKLNELVTIAIPDATERNAFIAELQTFTKDRK